MEFNSNLTVAYSQIFLEDFSCEFHFYEKVWSSEELSSMLCVGERFIIIGTVTSIKVPIFVTIVSEKPQIDLKLWDHVNECTIEVTSGILISGDFDDEDEILRIDLEKGIFGVFVCYNGLGTISLDGLEGNDSYHVFIWPSKDHINKHILKQWINIEENLSTDIII